MQNVKVLYDALGNGITVGLLLAAGFEVTPELRERIR